jgi:hypothetical protein
VVAHPTRNRKVVGSNPTSGSICAGERLSSKASRFQQIWRWQPEGCPRRRCIVGLVQLGGVCGRTEVIDERLAGRAVDEPDIRQPAVWWALHALHRALGEPDDTLEAEAAGHGRRAPPGPPRPTATRSRRPSPGQAGRRAARPARRPAVRADHSGRGGPLARCLTGPPGQELHDTFGIASTSTGGPAGRGRPAASARRAADRPGRGRGRLLRPGPLHPPVRLPRRHPAGTLRAVDRGPARQRDRAPRPTARR